MFLLNQLHHFHCRLLNGLLSCHVPPEWKPAYKQVKTPLWLRSNEHAVMKTAATCTNGRKLMSRRTRRQSRSFPVTVLEPVPYLNNCDCEARPPTPRRHSTGEAARCGLRALKEAAASRHYGVRARPMCALTTALPVAQGSAASSVSSATDASPATPPWATCSAEETPVKPGPASATCSAPREHFTKLPTWHNSARPPSVQRKHWPRSDTFSFAGSTENTTSRHGHRGSLKISWQDHSDKVNKLFRSLGFFGARRLRFLLGMEEKETKVRVRRFCSRCCQSKGESVCRLLELSSLNPSCLRERW